MYITNKVKYFHEVCL